MHKLKKTAPLTPQEKNTHTEILTLSFFVLLWRSLLLLLSAVAHFFLEYKPSFPYYSELLPTYHLPQWLYSWANFDGVHYLTIAEHGYIGTGSIQAFFPFFPYVLLHTLRLLFGSQLNTLLIGLLITNISFYILAITWFYFVKKLFSTKIAWYSFVVLLLFPTSFFFVSFYSESLFLLFVLAAFFAALKKNWFLAGIFAFVASATRVVGVFLVPALLIELFLQNTTFVLNKKETLISNGKTFFHSFINFLKEHILQICWLMLSASGVLLYMAFLNKVFNDPLYFVHVQASFGSGRTSSSLVMYPQVAYRALHILLTARPFDLKYWSYVQEFVVGTLGLASIIWAAKYTKISYLFFSLCAFIIPTLTGTFSSMPRYILVCFPVYLILSQFVAKKPKFAIVWFSISTLLLLLNCMLFIQGYWIA